MEKEELNEHESRPQLMVTEDMRSYLYDMSKWAYFLGIVGFVISTFMIISALTIGPALNSNPELAKMLGQLGSLDSSTFMIVFIIYGFIFFYPSFLLIRYSTKAKQGVLYTDQESLNEALAKLKSLFKYFGVLALGVMALYMITIFSSILGKVA